MNHSMNSDFEGLAGSGFQAGMCCFCRPGRLRCTRGLSFFSLKAEVVISRLVKGVRAAELSGECNIDKSGEGMVRAKWEAGLEDPKKRLSESRHCVDVFWPNGNCG
jgi:hypothetical protein